MILTEAKVQHVGTVCDCTVGPGGIVVCGLQGPVDDGDLYINTDRLVAHSGTVDILPESGPKGCSGKTAGFNIATAMANKLVNAEEVALGIDTHVSYCASYVKGQLPKCGRPSDFQYLRNGQAPVPSISSNIWRIIVAAKRFSSEKTTRCCNSGINEFRHLSW